MAKRYTQRTQNPPPARAYEFKSRLRHTSQNLTEKLTEKSDKGRGVCDRWGRMKPRPWLVIPPPRVELLPDGRYCAWSVTFPDLGAVERTADAASFLLRMLIQKRLYGQSWRWAAAKTEA